MKDIFIDANIVNRHFPDPPNKAYTDLILWLKKNDKITPDNNAYLVVSKKLLNEYTGGCQGSYKKASTIASILDILQREGRLNMKSNEEIKAFQKKHFVKKLKFKCNYKDRFHIPIILLSIRKMVLSEDINFIFDLINFPKFNVTAAIVPEKLSYK